MRRLRLAHFSDLHYTESPFSHPRESFRGKRLASFFSYYLGGRRERFHDAASRIRALLDDVDAARVDHAICTGDLTASSLEGEFRGIAELFGARLDQPDRFTVLPGNHDRYVETAVRERAFERRFGSLCPAEPFAFPFAKTIAQGVRLVGIDTSRPTGFLDSSGMCGPVQRDALRELLERDTRSVTLVAMHYGLLRWAGHPDRADHRLRDFEEVLDVLATSRARIALVLHGHMHGAFTVSHRGRRIVCAGSATDLLVDCGYFVYELDLDSLELSVERRHWHRAEKRYARVDASELESAMRERRGARLPRQLPLA